MKPIQYRFIIQYGENSEQREVHPTYKNDLSKEYELESNQQFFRQKLSGKLAFIRDDYDFLNQQDFNTEFILLLQESKDGGKTWNDFYRGKFMKTDCTWNDDDKKCEVNPNVYDEYSDVIAGLDKEYNLIKLRPEIKRLTIQKRPLIQVYLPGESVVSCFLGGTYWEQDVVEATDDEDYLINVCHFAKTRDYQEVIILESPYESLTNQIFTGTQDDGYSSDTGGNLSYFEHSETKTDENNQDYYVMTNGLRLHSNKNLWKFIQSTERHNTSTPTYPKIPQNVTMNLIGIDLYNPTNNTDGYLNGNGGVLSHASYKITDYIPINNNGLFMANASYGGGFFVYYDSDKRIVNIGDQGANIVQTHTDGVYIPNKSNAAYIRLSIIPTSSTYICRAPTNNEVTSVKLSVSPSGLYMRYLLDAEKILDLNTYNIPVNDLVENNRNYKKCIGYAFDVVVVSNNSTETPTEYGVRPDGKYYEPPYSIFGDKYYPVARSTWNYASYWFHFSILDPFVEESARTDFELRDTYPIQSVIQVLLEQFSDIKHEGTQEYSQFLYAEYNPVSYQKFHLLLSPKSNILHGNYDQPAMNAETTLNTILKMLRDVYKCFWFIEDGKLKIEHISYFRNGGTYNSSPVIGTDITKIENIRNGKKWGFLTSSYEFDKSDMPERFQFSWMDDVTEGFEGYPIEVVSKYVSPGRIEDVNITGFTTDVDYMMLNPGAISQDGFALFAAVYQNGRYELPIIERNVDGADLRLQNGYLSWITLQPNYYLSDLPAKKVVINKTDYHVTETSRKRKQKVKFPTLETIDTKKLVKTYLGNGQIEKISVNLSSRINEVTLKYDTEQ